MCNFVQMLFQNQGSATVLKITHSDSID